MINRRRYAMIGAKALLAAGLLMLPGEATFATTFSCAEFIPSCGNSKDCDGTNAVFGDCWLRCFDAGEPVGPGPIDCIKAG
jgi:hypothetical protein